MFERFQTSIATKLSPNFCSKFLPIPELIPFRLTRQIRNIMMPLQEKGFIESTMIHSLRALRNNCDLLLATMDIFVKEPSVDWKVNAEKQQQEMGDEGKINNLSTFIICCKLGKPVTFCWPPWTSLSRSRQSTGKSTQKNSSKKWAMKVN